MTAMTQPENVLPLEITIKIFEYYVESRNEEIQKASQLIPALRSQKGAEWPILPIMQSCRLFAVTMIPILYRVVRLFNTSSAGCFIEQVDPRSYEAVKEVDLRGVAHMPPGISNSPGRTTRRITVSTLRVKQTASGRLELSPVLKIFSPDHTFVDSYHDREMLTHYDIHNRWDSEDEDTDEDQETDFETTLPPPINATYVDVSLSGHITLHYDTFYRFDTMRRTIYRWNPTSLTITIGFCFRGFDFRLPSSRGLAGITKGIVGRYFANDATYPTLTIKPYPPTGENQGNKDHRWCFGPDTPTVITMPEPYPDVHFETDCTCHIETHAESYRAAMWDYSIEIARQTIIKMISQAS